MFSVTYEIVTPESAEHGEADEIGYLDEGLTLREAMRLASPSENCGRWWAETGEGRQDYRTGAVETRSIHPPRNITPSSYARVSRVLGCR